MSLLWILYSMTWQRNKLQNIQMIMDYDDTLSPMTTQYSVVNVDATQEEISNNVDIQEGKEDTVNNSPYAYVFMAFGCDPSIPATLQEQNQTHKPGYRPYLANMLAATKILRQHGSQADVIAMFQFANLSIKALPEEEIAMLETLNIQIRYIPPIPEWYDQQSKHFLVGVLHKIHIWNLTDYRRVLFVDGDVLPLQNLDYLMQMSDIGIFQESVYLSTARVPMIAGLFVITPNAALYEQIYQIVHHKIVHHQITRKSFDIVKGWGHVWDPTVDGAVLWESNRDNGTLWNYHGANSDQGIFYYVAKYLRPSMTQIMADRILRYYVVEKDVTTHINSTQKQQQQQQQQSILHHRIDYISTLDDSPIQQYKRLHSDQFFSSGIQYSFEVPNCQRWINYHPIGCVLPPYVDHVHFTHPIAKPWQLKPPLLPRSNTTTTTRTTFESALDLWWQTLYQLQEQYPNTIRLDRLLTN